MARGLEEARAQVRGKQKERGTGQKDEMYLFIYISMGGVERTPGHKA